jgi:glutathione S-transferase
VEQVMKLLGTPRSPYAWKVRIALEEKRIPYDYVIAPPADPESEVPRYNPLGQIPVLVRDDGTAIYDSPVIVDYVDGLAPAPKLIPGDFEHGIAVRRWQALGDGIIEAIVLLSRDEREPPAARRGLDWTRNQEGKIERGLTWMERDLGGRAFCHGDAFTLADISCGVALGYLDRALPRFHWRPSLGALAAHAARLAERASFQAGMPKADG